MKRLSIILIIALFAGISAAGVKYVAVVETDIDAQSGASATLTSADARLVTAELRREAVKNLPRDRYNIMTSETVQSMGGAVLEECAEENCVIALGSRIGADYIVRGTISKFQTRFTLTVEIYETEDGTLVGSSEPVRSEKPAELLELAAAACADMFRKFAGAQQPSASVPAPTPLPAAASAPTPAPLPAPLTAVSVTGEAMAAMDRVVSVTGEAKAAVDRVAAAANAFKDATSKSTDAANAVKAAMQSKNFSAIKDAKKKVESAAEAVKKARADVAEAMEALKTAGPEAEAAVKAMGLDIAMFAVKDGGGAARPKSADTVGVPNGAGTISEAIGMARIAVMVAPGVYRERVVMDSGMTLVSTTPFGARIDGGGMGIVITMAKNSSVTGFEVRNGAIGILSDGGGNEIRRCRVVENGMTGIMAKRSLPLIEDNVIAFNGASGIQAWGASGATPAVAVSHNTIAYNGNHGIAVGGASEFAIRNNVIAFNERQGLKILKGPGNVLVSGNNFYGNLFQIGKTFPEGNYAFDPAFLKPFAELNFEPEPGKCCKEKSASGENLGARLNR